MPREGWIRVTEAGFEVTVAADLTDAIDLGADASDVGVYVTVSKKLERTISECSLERLYCVVKHISLTMNASNAMRAASFRHPLIGPIWYFLTCTSCLLVFEPTMVVRNLSE
jgi:hypothetical protein